MITHWRRTTVLALLAATSLTCTNVGLYGSDRGAAEADRATIRGRVCTEDARNSDHPVRVVLVVDQGQTLIPGAMPPNPLNVAPLFGTFDPGGMRYAAFTALGQSALSQPSTTMSVIAFGSRSRKVAPIEGNFSRNPGEIMGGVDGLRVGPMDCRTGICRNYLEGLRTARATIEGDIAGSLAGNRILAQYVVILVVAGPSSPPINNVECCNVADTTCLGQTPMPDDACQAMRETQDIAELKASVERAGVGGLRVHVVHFAAEPDPAVNMALEARLRRMAFAGAGTYQRFDSMAGFSPAALDLFGGLARLRTKTLIAANLNARATPRGPVVDTDGDGLSDEREAEYGTSLGDIDTDNDRVTDFVETLVGFDPSFMAIPQVCMMIPARRDADFDGLTDCDEAVLGTDPTLVDTDGDGMPDGLEVFSLTDYLHADANADSDGDGASNLDEIVAHTDPRSVDTDTHLSFGYRYELQDEGVSRDLFAVPARNLDAVTFTNLSRGSSPGRGLLRWDPVTRTLTWKDPADTMEGPPVIVTGFGSQNKTEFDLPSSSWSPSQGQDGRTIRVRVNALGLPADGQSEDIRIVLQERQCLSYTIRNIRLMGTGALDGESEVGLNNIALYFAEAAEDRLTAPGPFKLTQVPITFIPPARRVPSAAIINVGEDEFFTPRPSAF